MLHKCMLLHVCQCVTIYGVLVFTLACCCLQSYGLDGSKPMSREEEMQLALVVKDYLALRKVVQMAKSALRRAPTMQELMQLLPDRHPE